MDIEEFCRILLTDIFGKDCWYTEKVTDQEIDIFTGKQEYPDIFIDTHYYCRVHIKENEFTFILPSAEKIGKIRVGQPYNSFGKDPLAHTVDISQPDSLDNIKKWLMTYADVAWCSFRPYKNKL